MNPVSMNGGQGAARPRPANRGARRLSRLMCGGALGMAGALLAAGTAWGSAAPSTQTHAPGAGGDTFAQLLLLAAGDDDPWVPESTAGLVEAATGAVTGTGAQEGPPGGWARPLSSFRVSAGYGIPGNWIAGHHTGIDLAVPVGTPVRSVGAGVVTRAGWGGDYGRMVMMRMNDGRYTLFAHMSKVNVRPGQTVGPNELLGYSGNTGRSSGPHLHFEVRRSPAYGSDINPVAYLGQHGVRL